MTESESTPRKTMWGDSNESQTELSVIVNGKQVRAFVADRLLLSDFLRDDLGLTALKVACGEGACGACTIVIDGEPARSCTLLAAQTEGAEILTLEGLNAPAGAEPRAANFPGAPCPAVRILHAGMADDRVQHDQAVRASRFGRGWPVSQRAHLPLHGLSKYLDGGPAGARSARRRSRKRERMTEKMHRSTARAQSRRYVGEAVLRAEDRELLQGRGGFLADLPRRDAAEICIVRSTEPHAMVRAIRKERALAMSGRDCGPDGGGFGYRR